ncbi:MAG: hypothetical protein WC518_03795 [Patescibacteria group bacterium]
MKKTKSKLLLIFVLTALAVSAFVGPALADGLIPENCSGTAENCNPCDIITVLVKAADLITGLSGTIALLMFIYGGLLWLTAYGKESQIQSGRGVIIATVIGLVIIFLAYTLISVAIGAIYGNSSIPALNQTGPCFGG